MCLKRKPRTAIPTIPGMTLSMQYWTFEPVAVGMIITIKHTEYNTAEYELLEFVQM